MENNHENDALIRARIERIKRLSPRKIKTRYVREKVIDQPAGKIKKTEIWYASHGYGGEPGTKHEDSVEVEVPEKSHYEYIPVQYETYGSLIRAILFLLSLPSDIRQKVQEGLPSDLQRELRDYGNYLGCLGISLLALLLFFALVFLQSVIRK